MKGLGVSGRIILKCILKKQWKDLINLAQHGKNLRALVNAVIKF